MTTSALYIGEVTHRRLRPKAHFLRYGVFQLCLDLDEALDLSAKSRIFGFNRASLLSFYERDHGDGSRSPLKAQIERKVAAAALAVGGPMQVLTLPRVLGYAFNPITLFFCHDHQGALTAVVHQVNNTFGERCFYVLPADDAAVIRQTTPKRMHVSPFLEMDHRYDFSLTEPAETFALRIDVKRDDTLWLTTGFAATRRAFTDMNLVAAWLRHPLLTLKVISGIHWEALKIWLKGVRYVPGPPLAPPRGEKDHLSCLSLRRWPNSRRCSRRRRRAA